VLAFDFVLFLCSTLDANKPQIRVFSAHLSDAFEIQELFSLATDYRSEFSRIVVSKTPKTASGSQTHSMHYL
jgi:hypothetical protein